MQHAPTAVPPVVLKHPETGVTDCVAPPPTCQGPCCGTCRASEMDLLRTGVRLLLTNEWVSAGYYYLQLAVTRTDMRAGTPLKCAADPPLLRRIMARLFPSPRSSATVNGLKRHWRAGGAGQEGMARLLHAASPSHCKVLLAPSSV